MARIVIAPDSFKGTASAAVAAAAIAEGWTSVRPDDDIIQLPMADGGEGTLDAFAAAVPGARWMRERVIGPDNAPVDADWLLLPDQTAVVELARASGITLLDPLLPLDAHTFGFGQLIASALEAGAHDLILAIGGSSSTDGGAGILAALGVGLLDSAGHQVSLGNRGLLRLDHVDWSGARTAPRSVIVLCDVRNPLLGPTGAATVFGPQKGATYADVKVLEQGLARLATVLGGDPRVPGSGAAGGSSYGLLAWGAILRPGATEIGARIGLDLAVKSCDFIITGEGSFDGQSSSGKAPHHVAELALEARVSCCLIAGRIATSTAQFTAAISLSDLAGSSDRARTEATDWLETAGLKVAELYDQARTESGRRQLGV